MPPCNPFIMILWLAILFLISCHQAQESNTCGGSVELPEHGRACATEPNGPLCGVWKCDGSDVLRCDGPAPNACGGCASLDGEPGEDCAVAPGGPSCGKWVCEGIDALRCEGPYPNSCNGCSVLSHPVGDPCKVPDGTDPCGVWECDGTDAVQCAGPLGNECHGCSLLPHVLGEPCMVFGGTAACGTWHCSGKEDLECVGPPGNACLGCSDLHPAPGSPCAKVPGQAACGTVTCTGLDSIACEGADPNACGGCAALVTEPESPCAQNPGEAACGVAKCTGPDEVGCFGDGVNACGGCSTLLYGPGTPCGVCGGIWGCADPDLLTCSAAPNACGGCTALPVAIGSPCSECGTYHCDGVDGYKCDFDPCNTGHFTDPDKLIGCISSALSSCDGGPGKVAVEAASLDAFNSLVASNESCFLDSWWWACNVMHVVDVTCDGAEAICAEGMGCDVAQQSGFISQCGGQVWTADKHLNCWSIFREAAAQCIEVAATGPWGNCGVGDLNCDLPLESVACEEGGQAYTCVPDMPWWALVVAGLFPVSTAFTARIRSVWPRDRGGSGASGRPS